MRKQFGVISLLCLIVLGTTTAFAADFQLWMEPKPTDLRITVDGGMRYYTDQAVEGEDKEYQQTQYDLESTFCLYRNETHEVFGEIDFTGLDIDTDVRLPRNRNDPFPDQLVSLTAGLTYRRFLCNGWLAGFNITYGSASDKLFNSNDESIYNATAFLRIPHKQHNAWMFYLNFANNRSNASMNNVPVPGFGYLLPISEVSWFVLGVPFLKAHYQPTERLTVDVDYMIFRTVHAKVNWASPIENLSIYGAFDMDSQVYYRAERKDEEDGLFMFEKRASAGLKYQVNKHINIDFSGGYAFGRFLFEGEKYSQRDQNRIDIDNGAFCAAQIEIDF